MAEGSNSGSSVLSVRLSAEERAKLESAAALEHTSLSDYVRRTVIMAAELAIMEQRVFTIPADKWDEFEAMLDRPPERNPKLEELFRRTESAFSKAKGT
jgi:uncharacterized protein (DUF1778 family)